MAKVAGVLALNVAHYRAEFGELPLGEHSKICAVQTINEEPAKMLADGFEVWYVRNFRARCDSWHKVFGGLAITVLRAQ